MTTIQVLENTEVKTTQKFALHPQSLVNLYTSTFVCTAKRLHWSQLFGSRIPI